MRYPFPADRLLELGLSKGTRGFPSGCARALAIVGKTCYTMHVISIFLDAKNGGRGSWRVLAHTVGLGSGKKPVVTPCKPGYIPVGPKKHAWICAGPQRSFDRFLVTHQSVSDLSALQQVRHVTHVCEPFLLPFSFSRPGLSISPSSTAANILVVERLTRKQESVKRWPVFTRPRQADKGIDVRRLYRIQ